VENHLWALAGAYSEYRRRQQNMRTRTLQNFHGLRDYYALMKSIGHAVRDDAEGVSADIVNISLRAVWRNFGGLPAQDPADTFQVG